MKRDRKTKLVATLGPASSSPEMIESLYLEGVDVFRLNFSHGTHETHHKNIMTIRALEEKYTSAITILMDLQGPKLRVGEIENGEVLLVEGQIFQLDQLNTPGTKDRAPLPHPEIFKALQVGQTLLLDDGKIRLKVKEVASDYLLTKVKVGGVLKSRKGVNVPGSTLAISALTEKDRTDLQFGLEQGVDVVGLSFVQKPEDVREAKRLIKGKAKVLSKIEKPNAVEHLDDIIALSDAVMVARGDLGVELDLEDVPCVKKQIIQKCRSVGKPVVVATQMLESMIDNPTPTRAEVSDVATAVYEEADAVMLSAESASGKYPLESVKIMDRIIKRVERDENFSESVTISLKEPEKPDLLDAIAVGAYAASQEYGVQALVTFTAGGSSSLRIAKYRPEMPVVALTPFRTTARYLNLVWGVFPVETDHVTDFKRLGRETSAQMLQHNIAEEGQHVILTAGLPEKFGEESSLFLSGSTNCIQVIQVKKHG